MIDKKLYLIIILVLAVVIISGCEEKQPPYYGTFHKSGGKYIEIPEGRMGGGDFESDISIPVLGDSQPTIIHWSLDVNVNNLLFGDLDTGDLVPVTMTPLENGILEIKPRQPLPSGTYCLVQGDPLAYFLKAWCFSTSYK